MWIDECMCAWSCLTLCNPMDCSLPGFSVHGIFQAKKKKKKYLSGLPFPTPNPGIKLVSSVSPAIARKLFTTMPPGKKPRSILLCLVCDCFCAESAELSHCKETRWPAKLILFTVWLFKKMFANPCLKCFLYVWTHLILLTILWGRLC